jgi:hypothetical protein
LTPEVWEGQQIVDCGAHAKVSYRGLDARFVEHITHLV